MIIKLNGSMIKSEADFHKIISTELAVEEFYGKNLDALWDLLSASVERPLKIIWKNSEESKTSMGEDFERIILIFQEVKKQDEKLKNLKDKFCYRLE